MHIQIGGNTDIQEIQRIELMTDCGETCEYQVSIESNDLPNGQTFLTLTGNMLTLQSDNIADVGDYEFDMKFVGVGLASVAEPITFSVQVNIEAKEVPSLNPEPASTFELDVG